MKLNKFHSLCINHAHRMYDMNKNLPAITLALKPNGDVLFLCRPFDTYEDKQLMYNMYASIMQVEKIKMYCFISEMWYYKSKTDNGILPSEHPDRQTGVMVITADKRNTLHNMFLVYDGQLIDEAQDYKDYENYIDLFNRLPKIPVEDLFNLSQCPKPDWYKTIKHASFINVPVEA